VAIRIGKPVEGIRERDLLSSGLQRSNRLAQLRQAFLYLSLPSECPCAAHRAFSCPVRKTLLLRKGHKLLFQCLGCMEFAPTLMNFSRVRQRLSQANTTLSELEFA